MKFGLLALVLAVALVGLFDKRQALIVASKAGEGLVGGVLFGLVAALDKWMRVRERRVFSLWRFRCVWLREIKVGLCAGFLAGVMFAAIALLAN
jgi:hypothetical protein